MEQLIQPERRRRAKPLGCSPQEAADRLNSSKSTIYRLLAAQKLRALKRGRCTLITADSLAEYEAGLLPFESRAAAHTVAAT